MKSIYQIILSLALLAPSYSQDQENVSREAIMPSSHAEIIETYCLDCHDAFTEEAGINLEDINYNIAHDIKTAELWQKVLNTLNSGEMPPEKKKQLPDEAKTRLLDDLSQQIVTARSILSDSGGVIPLRRLNRREYQNTIEDLIGVVPDVSNLPNDQAASEFDTLGGSLFFSSDQLENYLGTAKRALELSLGLRKQKPSKTIRLEPEHTWSPVYLKKAQEALAVGQQVQIWKSGGKTEKSAIKAGFLDSWEARKADDAYQYKFPQLARYIQNPHNQNGASFLLTIKGGYTRIKLPTIRWSAPGDYIIRVKAAHYPETPARFHYIEYLQKGNHSGFDSLGWRKVTGSFDDPEILEFTVRHNPGANALYVLQQRSHQDRADKNIWTLDQRKNGIGTPPGVWVDWVELEGPIATTSSNSFLELLQKKKGVPTKEHVQHVLRTFAEKAFRGKLPEQRYLDKLYSQYNANKSKGLSHDLSLNNTLAIILTSPKFLYMVEEGSDEKDAETLLDNYELATRLSYFLTSRSPDQLLLDAAEKGLLSDPKYLREHTDRLLNSSQIDRFIASFTHQWLEMHRLDMFQFNGVHYRNFDNATRENARQEIYAMIALHMKDKLPLKELLKADYIVINDVLADYYGVEGIKGNHFRKVSIPQDSPRGGILGTVAFHAMGSDGTRTSPVERGAWVLRHLMNTPPPPAPANVPQLSRLDGKEFTPQELQKAHQEEPQCAQCHRKIDPIGYGLENFDAAGQWRVQDAFYKRAKGGYGERKAVKTFPVNPSGELLDGREFHSFFELRDIVASHSDGFAHKLVEGLITYGLGRPYGFTDHDLAQEILEEAKPHQYTITECIHALIQSEQFRSR